MPTDNDGVMIVLSSPSGAGKTTLVNLLSDLENFETSIFDGQYLDDQVSSEYLENLEVMRSDLNKI